MVLKKETIVALKDINKRQPEMFVDRQFVKVLLSSLFGKEVLKTSSLNGNKAEGYMQLNPQKMQLVRGIFVNINLVYRALIYKFLKYFRHF